MEQRNKHVANLQNHINELEEGHHTSQSKLQEFITQSQFQGYEKNLAEKNRIASLQHEIENYQKQIIDLENHNRSVNFQVTNDLEKQRIENDELVKNIELLQKAIDEKENELRASRREYETLQEDFSHLQSRIKEINFQKEKQPFVSAKLDEVIEDKLSLKYEKLKRKFKQANSKILELLSEKASKSQEKHEVNSESKINRSNYLVPPISKMANFLTFNSKDVVEGLRKKYEILDSVTDDFTLDNQLTNKVYLDNNILPFTSRTNPKIRAPIEESNENIDRLFNKYNPNKIGTSTLDTNRQRTIDTNRQPVFTERLISKYDLNESLGTIITPRKKGDYRKFFASDVKAQASDESLIHEEISRLAEEGMSKYNLHPAFKSDFENQSQKLIREKK